MVSKKNSEYVRIEQPIFLRRKLLETAVESTEILRFFENYKSIRNKKVSQIKKLRTITRKIKREIFKLNKEMPESTVGEIKPLKKDKSNTKTKKTKRATTLDEELKRIKLKLSKLSI